MTDRIAHAALRLREDPALKEIVKEIGQSLQAEVLEWGPDDERGRLAWQEYKALQRLVAAIDQKAQPALEEIQTND